MDVLKKYLRRLEKRINPNLIFIKVVNNNDVKDLVIELNTIKQLYDKGIDANSDSLGEYAPFTIREKIKKGQPTDRVTLKDTGEFYKSFRIKVDGDEIDIEADTIKYDFDGAWDLLDIYGADILGLTNNSMVKLIHKIKIETERYFIKTIFEI